jgi:hypothetical protein
MYGGVRWQGGDGGGGGAGGGGRWNVWRSGRRGGGECGMMCVFMVGLTRGWAMRGREGTIRNRSTPRS